MKNEQIESLNNSISNAKHDVATGLLMAVVGIPIDSIGYKFANLFLDNRGFDIDNLIIGGVSMVLGTLLIAGGLNSVVGGSIELFITRTGELQPPTLAEELKDQLPK